MEKEFVLSHGELVIPCCLTEPEHGRIQRVILGVHGLGGCMEDQIQSGIAEEMALFGSATLRFDFPAHGQNPSDMLTLRGCVDTLYAAACYAKENYPQVEDLCIFATGFGAYVTLTCLQDLKELPGRLRLVVQTPSVCMDETVLAMKGISAQTLRAMDSVEFRTDRPFCVTYNFYKELRQNAVMADHCMPMLILHGESDDYIHREDIEAFHQLNNRSKLVIIPGASHRFLESGAWDMVLDLTRDWFEFEQVLLSDWE